MWLPWVSAQRKAKLHASQPSSPARLPPQSVLAAVKASFAALRARLASTAVGGALYLERPLFGLDLELRPPAVVVSPSLEEVQGAINDAAKQVGGVERAWGCWAERDGVCRAHADAD